MNRPICLVAMLSVTQLVVAQEADQVSEKDYLAEMPIVLSVSRLPQRLDETPGAVTILDREMIRMSGARDVADLLRLVPGFRVTGSFESNAPQGSYHSGRSDYSNNMQVLVDGRSVYSTALLGSTGTGLQAVAIEDIERIEVHRGSNSAAYGARAFLGTINIVTRDPVDTRGVQAQVASGDNGIQDTLVRLGWGDEQANFRLSADRRADQGLRGAGGPDRVNRVNFRADVRASSSDTLELRAGQSVIDAGVGFSKPGEEGNAIRSRQIDTSFVQLDWRRNLGVDEDLALQVSHTAEVLSDNFPYQPIPGVTIDFGARTSNDNLSLQHTFRYGKELRVVWGAELRSERIQSRPVFDTDAVFVNDFARLFGNLEWHLRPEWVLNTGGMFERNSISGEHFSPRAMLNWHVDQGQTLRYGVSQAYRPPSFFEKFASVRYYLSGVLLDSTYVSTGNVGAEKVMAREIGYLGDFPRLGLSLDVRVFEEQVLDLIKQQSYVLPGSGILNSQATDYYNGENFNTHGYEYQLKFKPWRDGQLIYSQSAIDSTQSVGNGTVGAYRSQSIMFMQHLSGGLNFSLMYSEADASHFPGMVLASPATSRTDVRLAKAMRLGGRRAELSFVVQNLGASYQDFDPSFRFYQQAYVMLRLEN
jgi:iron complex outermembrane receptor protein